jgi:phage portal protein BeeE
MWASGGASVRLVPDLDNLPALATEREALWSSLEQTSFLTTDEKRAIAGFSPAPHSGGRRPSASTPANSASPPANPAAGNGRTGMVAATPQMVATACI